MTSRGKFDTAALRDIDYEKLRPANSPVPKGGEPAQPKGVGSDVSVHGSVKGSPERVSQDTLPGTLLVQPGAGKGSDISAINSKLKELSAESFYGQDYGDVGRKLGLTRRQVSFYTAPTSPKNVPLALVIPWVRAFGSCEPLDWTLAQVGLSVATADDRQMAELGRLTLEISERQERVRELLRERAA